MKNSSQYRAEAREALKGKWGQAALVTFVYLLIVLCISGAMSLPQLFKGVDIIRLAAITTSLSALFLVGMVCVVPQLSMGIETVFLDVRRGNEVNMTRQMFSIGYANFTRSLVFFILLMLIISAVSFLWYLTMAIVFGLLLTLVVPNTDNLLSMLSQSNPDFSALFDTLSTGSLLLILVVLLALLLLFFWAVLYVSYRYSMTYFIMRDNQQLTAKEAMRASRKLTKGHCWQLFCLDMSFIGWILLSILFLPALLAVAPYQSTARASLYLDLKADFEDTIAEAAAEESKDILNGATELNADNSADDNSADIPAADNTEVSQEDFKL